MSDTLSKNILYMNGTTHAVTCNMSLEIVIKYELLKNFLDIFNQRIRSHNIYSKLE